MTQSLQLSRLHGKFSIEDYGVQKADILTAKDFHRPTLSKIEKIALGVIAYLVELPISNFIFRGAIWIMQKLGVVDFQAQGCIQSLEGLEGSCLLNISRSALKTFLIAYIVIGAPLIEESLFRDKLYSCQEAFHDHSRETDKVASRIALNGILFGAVHLDPFQGWTNIPLFLTTSMMGAVLAYLREMTGDTIAPTTTHILHNGTAMVARYALQGAV